MSQIRVSRMRIDRASSACRALLCGAVTALLATPRADAQQTVTLREAIAIAQQNSHVAEAAISTRDAARARDRVFNANLLPQISLTANAPIYRRAIEQDPLSAAAHGNLGFAFDAAGRLAEGEQALRRALLLAPQRSNARASLARNLLRQGRNDEALAEALRESEEWARLWALAIIHHASGHPAEGEAALRALIEKHAEAAAYQAAGVYAARGEIDLAFECLERAYDASDPGLSTMMDEPLLLSLHDDPRWGAFLRKMGLAD